MRFLLPSALIVLLLASGAPAYAECSWVLWVQVSNDPGPTYPWEIVQTVGTRQDCDKIVQAKVSSTMTPTG